MSDNPDVGSPWDIRMRLFACSLLLGLIAPMSCSAQQARSAARPAASQFTRGCQELDKSEQSLCRRLRAAVIAAKRSARDVRLGEDPAAGVRRQAALQKALEPLKDEAVLLAAQAHLLHLNRLADQHPQLAEEFLGRTVYPRLGVALEEMRRLQAKYGLAHDSLLVGCAIARTARAPVDEVFRQKQRRSWGDVLRARRLNVEQVAAMLRGLG